MIRVMLAAAMGVSLCSCGERGFESLHQAQNGDKEWTLLLYFSADSNNEGGAIRDINALERSVDTTDYHILVQIDRTPGNDSSNGDWTDCRRFLIEPDPSFDDVIRSTELESIGEVNMGDPQTVADFIAWGVDAYPAERYAVMIWGGATPNGIAADFSESSPDPIRTIFGELTEAYALATAAIGRRLDLCVLWGCNYGMFENDFVIKEYCDVTARSEIPTNYMLDAATAIPAWLNDNPAATARELGAAWVDAYIDTAVLMGAWASVDLGPGFVDLSLAVDTFGRELVKAGGVEQAEIAGAMGDTVHCYAAEFDLAHFAGNIIEIPTLPQTLRDAAQAVVDAYGYPPEAGKPLVNFRFADGPTTGNEVWPEGDTAALRGTKIRQTAYGDGGYLPFVANNAWHWFLDGQTGLPPEPLLTYEANSCSNTIESGSATSLGLSLRNSGGLTATGISGVLGAQDAAVTVSQSASRFPDIASEATGSSQTDFIVSVDPSAPAGHRIWFWLDLTADAGAYTNTTTFCLEVTGCAEASTRPCYEGPEGTEGVGACRAGVQTCSGGSWGGCEDQTLPDTESCDDGVDNDCDGSTDQDDPDCSRCTSDADCDDDNVCTTDSCDPSQGCRNAYNDLPCDDGDACTMNDACSQGVCAGAPLDADSDTHVAERCGGDDCDDADGSIHPDAAEICDDGVDNDCDGDADLDDPGCAPCDADGDCDDDDACNGIETCRTGFCAPGTPLDCDDDNVCTTDSCDPSQGCRNAYNDLPCDDGDACTMNDACSQGVCAGAPLDADSDTHVAERCGGDDCDDADGSIHPDAAEICDDGLDNDCDGDADSEDPDCDAGADPGPPGGCACGAGRRGSAGFWLVGLLLLGLIRTRRS